MRVARRITSCPGQAKFAGINEVLNVKLTPPVQFDFLLRSWAAEEPAVEELGLIMKVDGLRTPQNSTALKRTQRSGAAAASRFADSLSEQPQTGEPVAGGAISPVEALLSLQEVPDATTGRRKGIKRAENLLDGLENLHRSLLLGTVSEPQLLRLRDDLGAGRFPSGDPDLEALITQIEIRVEVELAKRGR